jgi:hypothetical protein
MALEIAGCSSRAFTADPDPDYRGLIARVVFKELRMRDGKIVGVKLNDPLVFIRRWAGEKPLERLADLGLSCPPDGSVMDGVTTRPKRQVSFSMIHRDLHRLQKLLTPEQEAEIESCYHELRGMNIISLNLDVTPDDLNQ